MVKHIITCLTIFVVALLLIAIILAGIFALNLKNQKEIKFRNTWTNYKYE